MRTSYIALVDAIAADISSGRLKAGERLLPQRRFAYEKGIADSTATRVYAELLRRRLVVGEVGRGTFVASEATYPSTLPKSAEGCIDLAVNFSTSPDQVELMSRSLSNWRRSDEVGNGFERLTPHRMAEAARITSEFFTNERWHPETEGFLFAGGGRQSIAAAIAAVVPIGGRLAVEALTYQMIDNISGRLGITPVPIAMDGEGIVPDALARAHRTGAMKAVYLQSAIHSPSGVTMSELRRIEIVRLVRKLGLVIIEDLTNGFLADEQPLAARAEELTITVDSLSARLAPGLAVGILHAPAAWRPRLAAALGADAWCVTPLSLAAGTRFLLDGTAAEVTRLKRADARTRQAIAADCLAGHGIKADSRSYHLWLEMPKGWRADELTAAAAQVGIAVTPARAFAVAPGHSPNAVRLALGLPSHAELRNALCRLANLIESRA